MHNPHKGIVCRAAFLPLPGSPAPLLLTHLTPRPRPGQSDSALPYKRTAPRWLKTSPEQVKEQIFRMARKGKKPSEIGSILRDAHGVAQVMAITGSKVLRILKMGGLAPQIPEDLWCLVKKAVTVRKHLERNRQDKGCVSYPPVAGLVLLPVSSRGECPRSDAVQSFADHPRSRTRLRIDAKFRLILIESRIHRLARYYRKMSQLPPQLEVRGLVGVGPDRGLSLRRAVRRAGGGPVRLWLAGEGSAAWNGTSACSDSCRGAMTGGERGPCHAFVLSHLPPPHSTRSCLGREPHALAALTVAVPLALAGAHGKLCSST